MDHFRVISGERSFVASDQVYFVSDDFHKKSLWSGADLPFCERCRKLESHLVILDLRIQITKVNLICLTARGFISPISCRANHLIRTSLMLKALTVVCSRPCGPHCDLLEKSCDLGLSAERGNDKSKPSECTAF